MPGFSETAGTTAARTTKSVRAPRRSWRQHCSTVAICLPLAAVIVLNNVVGRLRFIGRLRSCEYGWPVTFLERFLLPQPATPRDFARWRLWEGNFTLSRSALLVDLLIGTAILSAAVAAVELRRRRRRFLHITLRDLLLATAGCAAIAAYTSALRRDELRTIECLRALALNRNIKITFEPCCPDWFCDIIGRERLIRFGWRRVSGEKNIFLDDAAPTPSGGMDRDTLAAVRYLHDHHADRLKVSIGYKLPDSAREWLFSLSRLEHLRICDISLSGSMIDKFPRLRSLSIQETSMADASRLADVTRAIGRLRNLEVLHIEGELAVGDLTPLASLSKLKQLELTGPGLGELLRVNPYYEQAAAPGRLAPLSALHALRLLELVNLPIAPDDFKYLAPLTSLETFGVYKRAGAYRRQGAYERDLLSGPCLCHLAALGRLNWLSLDVPLDDTSVKSLPNLPALERLSIGGLGITEASLPRLSELPALSELKLDRTSIKTLAPLDVGRMHRLKDLDVSSESEIDRGSAAQVRARRPDLSVHFSHCEPRQLLTHPAPLAPGGLLNPRNWFRGRAKPAADDSAN